MSNTGVSTLFSKIFVPTLNHQHAGKKTGTKNPRRTPSEAILGLAVTRRGVLANSASASDQASHPVPTI